MQRMLAFWSSIAPLMAQATFVVDAGNGPGTNFTDITTAAASASVPSGSILFVRPGTYADVWIHGKGLTVLCEPGVFAGTLNSTEPFLKITATSAAQRVVVRDLRAASGNRARIFVGVTPGPVVLEGVPWITCHLAAFQARQLYVRGYSLAGNWLDTDAAFIEYSNVVFESCSLVGAPRGHLALEVRAIPANPGLRASVQLVHCSLLGGSGWIENSSGGPIIHTGSPAVFTEDALRITGLATHTIASGVSPGGIPSPPAIINQGGTVRMDPQIVLWPATGAPPMVAMPSVLTSSAAVGGAMVVQRYGPSGAAFALVAGFFGPLTTVAGLSDPVWMNLNSMVVDSVGVGTAGAFQVQRAVPNVPGLRGLSLVWHSVEFGAGAGFSLSNPSVVTVH